MYQTITNFIYSGLTNVTDYNGAIGGQIYWNNGMEKEWNYITMPLNNFIKVHCYSCGIIAYGKVSAPRMTTKSLRNKNYISSCYSTFRHIVRMMSLREHPSKWRHFQLSSSPWQLVISYKRLLRINYIFVRISTPPPRLMTWYSKNNEATHCRRAVWQIWGGRYWRHKGNRSRERWHYTPKISGG